MRIVYILFNAIAAVGLFFLNGLLGKLQCGMSEELFAYGKFTFESTEKHNFSGNFFQKIVNPAVYLSAVAAVFQNVLPVEFLESMWLLIPLFWVCRLFYMFLTNAITIINKKYEVFAAVLSLFLGEGVFFGIIKPLIEQGDDIWIPVTALRDALWFAILAYIAKMTWEIMKQSFSEEKLYPNVKRQELVWKRYDAFNKKYGDYILGEVSQRYGDILSQEKQSRLICLVYAIMIYEDYNRPPLRRMVERAAKRTFFRHRNMTLGIMQTMTDRVISDIESISYAIDKISTPFIENAYCPEQVAVRQYNDGGDYLTEVMGIFEILGQLLPYDRENWVDNESYKI